jgi:hypothetical protein
MWHVLERREVWWGDQTERTLGRSKPRQDCILKWMIMKWNEKAQTGLIWLRIQTGSE